MLLVRYLASALRDLWRDCDLIIKAHYYNYTIHNISLWIFLHLTLFTHVLIMILSNSTVFSQRSALVKNLRLFVSRININFRISQRYVQQY